MDLEKFYLQTKHWKLFLYFILFSVISQIIAVPALLNRGNLPVGILFGLIGSVGLLAFLGWFYFIISHSLTSRHFQFFVKNIPIKEQADKV